MALINGVFDSEREAINALQAEGKRLQDVAIKVWRQYLASYTPKTYVRSGDSERAIKLGKVKKIDEETLGIELTFEDDLAYHNSVVSSNGKPKGHSFMLISSGWHAVNLERKIGKRERFTSYRGFNYIGKVIEEFNNGKHDGVELEIQWSNKYTK